MGYKDSTYLDNIKQFEMTGDHRKLLEQMMGWYWSVAKQRELITPEDYDFLYNLWNNGVTSYDEKMKERLNKIRNLYKETNVL
jgi:hypothetical protein|tara:strand:- start:1988 stop:2236 length:249 start_codon:yes stop_codon:yes gene_type:complete